jgi:hypothetical protein
MEQPRRSKFKPRIFLTLRVLIFAVFMIISAIFVTILYFLSQIPGSKVSPAGNAELGALFALAAIAAAAYLISPSNVPSRLQEEQARQRVRQAEDDFRDAIAGDPTAFVKQMLVEQEATLDAIREVNRDLRPPQDTAKQGNEDDTVAEESQDDRLTLAALWGLTHTKLDLYHTIVTGQARRSFGAAQAAMTIGFVLLVGFAVLAAEAKTTAAAISSGGLGAVGAAFAAYIGKTFIRSQESAASHLRAYFDQPLELSRYLAAERLLADAKDLTPEQRGATISALVQSIATAGHENGNAKDGKSTSRQSRGRASR